MSNQTTSAAKADRERKEGTSDNRRRTGQGGNKYNKGSTGFKGETPGMQGKVFRLQSEHSKKGEFKETLEALERYAGRVYPLDTTKLQQLFKDLELPSFVEPIPPGSVIESDVEGVKIEELGPTVDEWTKIKYIEDYKLYIANQERLDATLIALYNVAWGQCSKRMQDRLKAEDNYEALASEMNVAKLLKLIKVVGIKFEGNVCLDESLWEAKHRFLTYRQGDYDSNSAHIRNIKLLHEVIEHYGGGIFEDGSLFDKARERFDELGKFSKTDKECKKAAKERGLAIHALRTSKHKGVLKMVRDNFIMKEDKYPATLEEAYEMLTHYTVANNIPETKGANRNRAATSNQDDVIQGAQYAQEAKDDLIPGTDGKTHNVKCYTCNRRGHYSGKCPSKASETEAITENEETHYTETLSVESDIETDDESVLISFNNHLAEQNDYLEGDILLDTGSTVSVFRDTKMLTDVAEAGKTMRALTNGGHQDSTRKGILPGFFPVWVNEQSRLNILSWRDVREKFRITADTAEGNKITVHLGGGKKMVFEEVESGLYLYRMNGKNNHSKKRVSSYSFLTLVETNKSLYTSRQIKLADEAKRLYEHLGMPGYKKFFHALEYNQIKNCPITVDDAKRCLHIYGPVIAHLQGKTTRRKANAIPITNLIDIPREVVKAQQFVNLSADYFFIQGIPVLHTISRNFNFRTVEFLINKQKATVEDTREGIKRIYYRCIWYVDYE